MKKQQIKDAQFVYNIKKIMVDFRRRKLTPSELKTSVLTEVMNFAVEVK